jgi:hypothetical protein
VVEIQEGKSEHKRFSEGSGVVKDVEGAAVVKCNAVLLG